MTMTVLAISCIVIVILIWQQQTVQDVVFIISNLFKQICCSPVCFCGYAGHAFGAVPKFTCPLNNTVQPEHVLLSGQESPTINCEQNTTYDCCYKNMINIDAVQLMVV